MVLVKVIAFEQLLDAGTAQVNLVLLDSFSVLPLLIVDVVLVEVDLARVRDVRCRHCSVNQCLPIEVGEPGVLLNFSVALVTQSVASLASEAFVDEFSRIDTPARRNLILFDLLLLLQDGVADLTPTLAQVRPPPVHALPSNNAYREVISCDAVVVLAHDFGRHVARCAAGLVAVVDIGYLLTSDSKVGQLQISVCVKDQILRLDIPVYNICTVHHFKRLQ